MIDLKKIRGYVAQNIMLLFSASMFMLSVTQYAYCTSYGCKWGFYLYAIGWIALYIGGPMLSWLANPLLFISWWYFRKRPDVSLFYGLLSLIFMVVFLGYKRIYDHDYEVEADIVGFKAGYWLWLSSSVTIVIGSIFKNFISKKINLYHIRFRYKV